LANDKLILTLVIILVIDVILFFGQVAVNNVVTEYSLDSNDNAIFNMDKSFIQRFNDGADGSYSVITNSSGIIPEASDSVSTETGNLFTDSARSIKTWLANSASGVVTGWNYFTNFLSGPVHYFENINAPQEFIFGLGALWYGLTILLLILLIFNR